MVVTNGDNTYDPAFLEEVLAAPPDSDVVAVDFYSRYQRPTGQCRTAGRGFGARAEIKPLQEDAKSVGYAVAT